MSKKTFKRLMARKHKEFIEFCYKNHAWPKDMTSVTVRAREQKKKEAEKQKAIQERNAAKKAARRKAAEEAQARAAARKSKANKYKPKPKTEQVREGRPAMATKVYTARPNKVRNGNRRKITNNREEA